MINIGQINSAPSLTEPVSQLGLQVQVPEPYSFGKDRFGNIDHCRRVAPQSGVFAAGCGHRTNPLEFVYLISEPPRFFQELGRALLPTPNPHQGKHRQRGAARGGLRSGRRLRRRDCRLPVATRQLKPAVARLQVGVKADEFAFFGQRQRLDHERFRLIEAELVQQAPDEADVRATRILDVVDGQGNAHSFAQIFLAAWV